jgi:hypothetical protein
MSHPLKGTFQILDCTLRFCTAYELQVHQHGNLIHMGQANWSILLANRLCKILRGVLRSSSEPPPPPPPGVNM